MNANEPGRVDVEGLVRDYLSSRERDVDARAMLDAVNARRRAEAGTERRPAPRRPLALARWAATVAATVLVVGFAWRFHQPRLHADAVRIVREATAALASAPEDRVYRIRLAFAPGAAERRPLLAAIAAHELRLHARPDRFWIEARRGDRSWSLGRDERRHAWLAVGTEAGLDFGPEELPGSLVEMLDLFHLDLDSVLHLLAEDFDVEADDAPGAGERGRIRIVGKPRAGGRRAHTRPSSVVVEIDEATRTVREVVLARERDGRPVGDVTFRLEGNASQPDAAYRLPSHLAEGAAILDHERRPARRLALLRFLGSLLLEGE